MALRLLDKRSVTRTAIMRGRILLVALAMIFSATCKRTPPPNACLQFSSDLMPDLHRGTIDAGAIRQVIVIAAGIGTIVVFERVIG